MTMNALNERGRALEEDYFRRMGQRHLESLRRREMEARERERLSLATGFKDEASLEELQALGFTPETVAVLELVPLVEMAWAEGSVQARERKEIIEAALRRGVEADSAAHRQLTDWFEHRPSDEFFARSLRLIKSMLQQLPRGERDLRFQNLIAHTYRVAKASGGVGFLSIGKRVCREEEATFDRIVHDLEPEIVTT